MVISGDSVADLFGEVTLGNASDRKIVGAQLAWQVDVGAQKMQPLVGFGPAMTLDLDAAGVVVVGKQHADLPSLFQHLANAPQSGGTITLAVVSVKFEDGSNWTMRLDPETRFRDTESKVNLEQRFRTQLLELKTLAKPRAKNTSPGPSLNGLFGKCQTSDQVLAVVAGIQPAAIGCGPFLVCNPSNMICNLTNYPDGSTLCENTNPCINPYQCHTQCCALNPCTGQLICYV
jgi:hypothetical protein